jgi:hypothetical protein
MDREVGERMNSGSVHRLREGGAGGDFGRKSHQSLIVPVEYGINRDEIIVKINDCSGTDDWTGMT